MQEYNFQLKQLNQHGFPGIYFFEKIGTILHQFYSQNFHIGNSHKGLKYQYPNQIKTFLHTPSAHTSPTISGRYPPKTRTF